MAGHGAIEGEDDGAAGEAEEALVVAGVFPGDVEAEAVDVEGFGGGEVVGGEDGDGSFHGSQRARRRWISAGSAVSKNR